MSLFSMSVATPVEPPPIESMDQAAAVKSEAGGPSFMDAMEQANTKAANEAQNQRHLKQQDASKARLGEGQSSAEQVKGQLSASEASNAKESGAARKKPAVAKSDSHDATADEVRRENVDAVALSGGPAPEVRPDVLSGGLAEGEGEEAPVVFGGSGLDRLLSQGVGVVSEPGEGGMPQNAFEMLRASVGMNAPGLNGPTAGSKGEFDAIKITAPGGVGGAAAAKKADGAGVKTEGMRPTLSTRSPDFADELANKVGRLRVISRPGQTEQARIILQPRELGEIRIQMSVDEVNKVQLSISTETEAAKEVLNRQMSQLKEALARQDLGLADVSVEVADRDTGFSWKAHDSGDSPEQRAEMRRAARAGRMARQAEIEPEPVIQPPVRAGPGMSIFA
ncbi:MAG: flagellar hook-length control protein FliK [Magnetococcales bacterium]|nr:flagellar hook-length control protein FliK [Magnetococcales bacterium]